MSESDYVEHRRPKCPLCKTLRPEWCKNFREEGHSTLIGIPVCMPCGNIVADYMEDRGGSMRACSMCRRVDSVSPKMQEAWTDMLGVRLPVPDVEYGFHLGRMVEWHDGPCLPCIEEREEDWVAWKFGSRGSE